MNYIQRPQRLATVGGVRPAATNRLNGLQVPAYLVNANLTSPTAPGSVLYRDSTGLRFAPENWPRCALRAQSMGECVECVLNSGGDREIARRYCSQLGEPIMGPIECTRAPTYRECMLCAQGRGVDPYQAARLCAWR